MMSGFKFIAVMVSEIFTKGGYKRFKMKICEMLTLTLTQ